MFYKKPYLILLILAFVAWIILLIPFNQDKNKNIKSESKKIYSVISSSYIKETDKIKVKYNKTFYPSDIQEIVVPKDNYYSSFLDIDNNKILKFCNKGIKFSSKKFSGNFKIEDNKKIILLSEKEYCLFKKDFKDNYILKLFINFWIIINALALIPGILYYFLVLK